MKNGVALSIIVIAFAAGSFIPYFYMDGKIEETHLKIDKLMGHIQTNSEKIDNLYSVAGLGKDANAPQEKVSDNLDPKLEKKAIVQIKNTADM